MQWSCSKGLFCMWWVINWLVEGNDYAVNGWSVSLPCHRYWFVVSLGIFFIDFIHSVGVSNYLPSAKNPKRLRNGKNLLLHKVWHCWSETKLQFVGFFFPIKFAVSVVQVIDRSLNMQAVNLCGPNRCRCWCWYRSFWKVCAFLM